MKPLAVLVIARNVFEEARHNRVLYIGLGFALLLIVFSYFLGQVSLHQDVKVVKDLGMGTISLMGVFVAIYLSVNTLFKELQQRTVYTIISKPIRRFEIVLGKFLGMALVLGATVVLMTFFLLILTSLLEFQIDIKILPAIVLIYFELLVVAGLGLVFSSFSSPFLSGFFTFGIFLIGRVSYELGQFGERSQSELFRFFATGVQKIFDLESFNLRTEVVHGLPIYIEDFWGPILYAVSLMAVCLLVSAITFERRDFK
jgi:ABC-type transport system involved in multi-copper enzyme maturation permease subunit